MAAFTPEEAALGLSIALAIEDAIISTSADGIIASWNPGAELIYGYSAAEAVGQSIDLIISPDRREAERAMRERVLRGDIVRHVETVRRRRDGSEVLVSLSIAPVRDSKGAIIGTVRLTRDISAHRLAEHDARRLAAIVTSSEDAIVSKNLQGIVMTWNQAAERMFGYTAEEIVGCSIRTIIPLDRQAEEDHVLALLARGERVEHFETVRCRKDGTTLPVSLTISPIHGRDGTVIGASKIVRDISERHRVAEERERLLAASREQAEMMNEVNRLKDEFLATLSHELRTPLNAILGYARMLRMNMITPQHRETAIATVERNARSLAQIVEDVLDVSRFIAGKMRLNVQPVDLPDVVRRAVETIVPAADAKGLRVETRLDPRATPVSGDPERLQQVCWNLLSNAVKFTPRDGRVLVCVERIDSHVDLTVSDTGIGIPREFLPHVFEYFRQAEGGPSRERGGLGLGLGIARQLVEMHGGTIHASSPGPGQGATFRIRLPLRPLPEAVAEPLLERTHQD